MPGEVTSSSATRAMRRVAALAMLGLCLALAACGDDDDAAGGPNTTTAPSNRPIPSRSPPSTAARRSRKRPARVVTLDNQATDDALALGVVPVGMAKVTFVPGGIQSWTKQALGGERPKLINLDSAIPYEQVAALRPDLILATNTYPLEERSVYDRLSRIAPTVHFVDGSLSDSWQDVMRRGSVARAACTAEGVSAGRGRDRAARRGCVGGPRRRPAVVTPRCVGSAAIARVLDAKRASTLFKRDRRGR